ncbi:MAG: hemH [Gammaproteobacteria bacterium]|jgi:ferrochelatase|nr:hemH [Gammaproteobacteria bacterium]
MHNTGVLLINLGTPDNSDNQSVYRYLIEFLNDPRIIDLPKWWRWILTHFFIVPFRYKKTAQAYRKIWSQEGSPLLLNSRKLQSALAIALGQNYHIEIAMRYGNPTIQSALQKMKHCHRLIAIPLFPQYSSAATGSAIDKLLHELASQWNIPEIHIIRDFYKNTGFIESYAAIIQKSIDRIKLDSILFSYHGLPERHINKSHCRAPCDRLTACPSITGDNFYCYRAQCYMTSSLLAAALGLEKNQYKVVFQSRLGRTPWIQPYTDILLANLRQEGKKNIAIVCPSFVADCLETLEEINMRAREQWSLSGGSKFIFIPCLNDHPLWVKALAASIFQLS